MWNSIKKFFKDSETIFWARLKLLIGALLMASMSAEAYVQELLTDTQFAIYKLLAGVGAWFLFDGSVSEWLRRRRDEL